MFYNAKNERLMIGDTDMDYISFGKGKKNLILIPGLGDGLTTVRGLAIPYALTHPEFAKEYKVYVFSRKNRLKQGYTTKDMARDVFVAMSKLGIKKANIVGISQGGMIAQHLALDHPERVNKLVLAVTICRQNETIQKCVSKWMRLAKEANYRAVMKNTAEKMYVKRPDKMRYLPILEKFCAPKDFERYLIMGKACLEHDTYEVIHKIQAPTLVIGGAKDIVLEGESSVEIAERIPNSRCVIFKEYGHGVYVETKKFAKTVLDFFRGKEQVYGII